MKQNRKVILIMTDSQRHDMVSCYKDNGLSTPFIDSIAKEGIRFDKAYTTQPVCQPARAGIFTGMYPHSSGCFTNCVGISSTTRTIGRRLQDEGIHTAFIGKWHLDGGDYFGLGKAPDGWDSDYWYDMKNYLDELSPEDRALSRNSNNMLDHNFGAEFTYGYKCATKAIDFLEKHSSEDFFLSLSFDEPHDPAICPKEFFDMYKDYTFPNSINIYDTLENKPDFQKVWAGKSLNEDRTNFQTKSRKFFGCNSFVDSQIGRVLASIEKLVPDAIVIYTSDHGDFLGSHRLSAKGPSSYEEITHIPFLIKGKDIPKNKVDINPVSHINIAPTIFEIMGIPQSQVFEGKSLLSEIEGDKKRVNDYIFMEFTRYEVDHDGFGGFQPMRSCYDGRYKLTINLMSTDELYDLEKDPEEMVNLIDNKDTAKIRDTLHNAILKNMNDTRDPFRGYYWEDRPWRLDATKPTWDYTKKTRQRIDDKYEARQLDYSTGLAIKTSVRDK
ncbi:MAG: sulfatase-like hydrolase/transferase [Clostridia bacterium]